MSYRTYSHHCKEKFGCKVYKLSLDGGFTCPNRDGTVSTGGCIFCSALGGGEFAEHGENITAQLEKAKTRVAAKIKDGSMCGLGQTAPNPVLTTLKYFRNEYEDHIYNKKCTAGACKALIHYEITDKCVGCTKCARNCPVSAISGNVKEPHVIDNNVCIGCGTCLANCKFGASTKR